MRQSLGSPTHVWGLKRRGGGECRSRASARWRSGAIQADRSGCPRRCAGCSARCRATDRVPQHGSLGSTLFLCSVGPISRDVRDAATLLQLLAQPSVDDPLCRLDEPPDYLSGLDDGIAGLRLGWWEDQSISGQVDAAVISAIRNAAFGLDSLGANLVDDAVTFDTQGVDEAWRVLDFVDRYAALGESLYTDPLARRKLTQYARERFAWAKGVSGADYSRAVRRRADFIRSFEGRLPQLRSRALADARLHRAGDQIRRSRPSASRRWSPIRWPSISPASRPPQFPAASSMECRSACR